MTQGYGVAVRQEIQNAGCRFHRHGKGDHDIWIRPDGRPFTIPVKIMSRHTANAILKQAGLPKKF